MSDVVGQIGSVKVRLADWLSPSDRYQRRYVPVDPEGGVISEEPGLHADSKIRLWVISDWSGGEGDDRWTRDSHRYRKSDGVTLRDLENGLKLARRAETTQDNTGAADFQDGGRFGFGQGSLWAMKDDTGYPWDRTNGRWDTGIGTGIGSAATSVTDGDDTWMYSGHANGAIRRWKSGSNEAHYASGAADPFTYPPVVRSFQGRLFALDGDDLYEIDKDTADTRTILGDPTNGSSDDYLTNTPWSWNRMSLSDKGPIWLQRLDNGQTFIWEYNVAEDVQRIIGKLSVDFAYPYSIYFSQGYVFVGFRYANDHDQAGQAALFFGRGAQRGVVGPFRSPTEATASKPVLIGGQIGDDLIMYFDGVVWAYNFSDSGIREVAQETLSGGPPEDFVTFGQEIFAGPYASDEIERYLADEYVASGTLSTGRFAFDYPGLRKLLTNVGVVTEPLPADVTVTMKVSVDGGAAVALTDPASSHDGDGNRRFVWLASDAANGNDDFIGYEFEFEVGLATSDASATPEIVDVWAAVTGAAHRIEWIVAVDVTKWSHKMIDDLNGLADATVLLKDPWQNRGSDDTDDVVVTVEDVVTPERLTRETNEKVHALVRMRARDLVGVSGGS